MNRQKVNILTRYDFPLFEQHFSDVFSFDVFENSDADIDWDCVVVFDGVPRSRVVKVKAGNLIFVAGEPPESQYYTRHFLSQFDVSYCAHPSHLERSNNIVSQHFNNWHFGFDSEARSFRYSYEDIMYFEPPQKTENMSVIVSNLAYMPNHLKRLRFVDALRTTFKDQIDVFGRGHNFIQYKEDAILPYRFHFCFENTIRNHLWTEKISDSLLGFALPLYAGAPNIDSFFPNGCVTSLDLDDIERSLGIVDKLLQSPEVHYASMLPVLKQARRRLIQDYSFTSLIVERLHAAEGGDILVVEIRPNEGSRHFAHNDLVLRVKRQVFKRFFLAKRKAS